MGKKARTSFSSCAWLTHVSFHSPLAKTSPLIARKRTTDYQQCKGSVECWKEETRCSVALDQDKLIGVAFH